MTTPPWVLDVRTLAAIDTVLHGPRLIVAEFAVGVVGCAALGAPSMRAGVMLLPTGLSWQLIVGLELLCIALNYVPLLLHSVSLASHSAELQRIAREVRDRPALVRRYGVLQLWILVPAAVIGFAIAQRNG